MTEPESILPWVGRPRKSCRFGFDLFYIRVFSLSSIPTMLLLSTASRKNPLYHRRFGLKAKIHGIYPDGVSYET